MTCGRLVIKYLILLLPSFCYSKMKIEINTASNIEDAAVKFSGQDNKLISDLEIKAFNLTKHNLNRGMRVELGRIPNDIYLKDPTPYDDLFEMFEWPEVKRNLRVTKAKVIQIVNENVVLQIKELINNTTQIIKSPIRIFERVDDTIYSSWSENGLPEDEIFYDITVNFDKVKLKYENQWRNTTQRTFNLNFGIAQSNYMLLKSNQTVTTKLSALHTIILIEVDYLAKLIGNFIADYESLYGKYHFYAPTVANIMRAAKLINEIKTTETMELRCYTDPKLEIFDNSGRPIEIFTPLKSFRSRTKRKYV